MAQEMDKLGGVASMVDDEDDDDEEEEDDEMDMGVKEEEDDDEDGMEKKTRMMMMRMDGMSGAPGQQQHHHFQQLQIQQGVGVGLVQGGGGPIQVGGGCGGGIGVRRSRPKEEKERTKLRERHRRAITARILSGLRRHGNYNLRVRADINDVIAALAREAGWMVLPDGTTLPPPTGSPHNPTMGSSELTGPCCQFMGASSSVLWRTLCSRFVSLVDLVLWHGQRIFYRLGSVMLFLFY